MLCAIAAENDLYDAEVYRALLEVELGENVERWRSDLVFTGWKHIRAQLPLFLQAAADQKVTRALVAIDNDGGSKRHPEHLPAHDAAAQASDREGCRFCALATWLPASWRTDDRRACITVPVQTLETWRLCVSGHDFGERPPEAHYEEPIARPFAKRLARRLGIQTPQVSWSPIRSP